MTSQAWIVLFNAFAGFYAATVWGFFGILRLRNRDWGWACLDAIIAGCGIVVGIAYYTLATTPESASPWFELLRLLVVPILILPTILHMSIWRRSRQFLHRAEVGDDG